MASGQTFDVQTVDSTRANHHHVPITISDEDKVVPTTKLRQAIGRRLVESKTTIPHFYVTHEFKMDALMDMRKQVNAYLPDDEKVSVNDFILKGVALALRQFPNLNATIKGNEDHPVRTRQCRRGGDRPRRPDDRRRQGHRPEDAAPDLSRSQSHGGPRPRGQGQARGCGWLDLLHLQPGHVRRGRLHRHHQPARSRDSGDRLCERSPVLWKVVRSNAGWRMKATISVDHRVSDGAEAAQFMQALAEFLENPVRMLV
ncbi:MAG: 2-oxo acid dehydrogenase subunit E2 [Ignavibacteriales bacterium]|nr:2-oxo acid dehydrogenase subunit E2 [Ignavibacteriales bacterium]